MLENKREELVLSPLEHTWILDLDGTIVRHNGYKQDGKDTFLAGAEKFLRSIPEKDMIIFLTSRTKDVSKATEEFLHKNKIRYSTIVYDVPYGERILINDRKPSGLEMAVGINVDRDAETELRFRIEKSI